MAWGDHRCLAESFDSLGLYPSLPNARRNAEPHALGAVGGVTTESTGGRPDAWSRPPAPAHPRGAYQRIAALPQVKPDPKAVSITRSPFRMRPSTTSSWRAMGMEAAVVLPYRSMLL